LTFSEVGVWYLADLTVSTPSLSQVYSTEGISQVLEHLWESSLGDIAVNAATGQRSEGQVERAAQQVAADVKRAGGSILDQAAAYAEQKRIANEQGGTGDGKLRNGLLGVSSGTLIAIAVAGGFLIFGALRGVAR
jgi:hypothetical protein